MVNNTNEGNLPASDYLTTQYAPKKWARVSSLSLTLVKQEFTINVDFSQLPCGPNGAPCFSPMNADGGMSRFSVSRVTRWEPSLELDTMIIKDPTISSALMEKHVFTVGLKTSILKINNWIPASNSSNTATSATGTCSERRQITSPLASLLIHCYWTDILYGPLLLSLRQVSATRPDATSAHTPGITVDTTHPFIVATQSLFSKNESTGTLSANTCLEYLKRAIHWNECSL
ncbi:hypothetical protein F5050DRAFT_1707705 [Lentinula boryana]|uniref:Glucanase n=1 Tax=Lentinula boryana TaxID=40481 RepID=A0ABQ8QUW2_9AGAR|nr:hypothetical protein F5050DRAFT_1707705 [Lentinula boryana]